MGSDQIHKAPERDHKERYRARWKIKLYQMSNSEPLKGFKI